MRVLVTGSAGFIGYHLSKSLLSDDFNVLGVDNLNNYYDVGLKKHRLKKLTKFKKFTFEKGDITSVDGMKKIFKDFLPDIVVNLAAQPGVRYSLENPYVYVDSNINGFVNIIELCKDYEVQGLIYASSSSVYGKNKKTPFSVFDDVSKPRSLYGASKRSNELISHAYSDLYGLHTTGLRYFTVYGPYYRPDMAIHIFSKKIFNGEKISVYNNGNMKRDFTYIDDIIHGTRSAIDKNYSNEIFNLGNNKNEKLMDLVHILEEQIGIKAKINFEPIKPGDVVETHADIDYSISKLGYCPNIDISEGIPIFVKWYKEYYNV